MPSRKSQDFHFVWLCSLFIFWQLLAFFHTCSQGEFMSRILKSESQSIKQSNEPNFTLHQQHVTYSRCVHVLHWAHTHSLSVWLRGHTRSSCQQLYLCQTLLRLQQLPHIHTPHSLISSFNMPHHFATSVSASSPMLGHNIVGYSSVVVVLFCFGQRILLPNVQSKPGCQIHWRIEGIGAP